MTRIILENHGRVKICPHSACQTGKIKHKSRLGAEFVLNKMTGQDSHLLEIYNCPFCKNFHIGHKRKTYVKGKGISGETI